MRFLMSNPRNSLRVVEGVISMLAGDVFANSAVRRKLLVFKTIYLIAWLVHWREGLAVRRRRGVAISQNLQGTE